MADQAVFAYQVQLPDGNTAVRTGGADRPPTHGELADYAANQGERYLGPVPMSPVVPTESTPAEAPPAPPARAAAVAPPATVGEPVSTLLPDRSIASQVPSMVGGLGGAYGGVPLGAIAGAALGSGGLEYLQAKAEQEGGVAPSEQGTPGERAYRAAIRGGVGETGGQALQLGAQVAKAVAGPTLRATESLAPTLTRDLPPEAMAATTRVGQLIRDPAALAGAELTPQGQQTVLSAWWQHHAPQGAQAVSDAWNALGPAGQSVLAGPQRDAMSTLVSSVRPGSPLLSMSMGDILSAGGVPTALWHYGVIPKEAAVGLTLATKAAQEYLPRLLTKTPVLDWVSQ